MKKTISALAILASATSAQALRGPIGPVPEYKKVCLQIFNQDEKDGALSVGSCDMTARNQMFGSVIVSNGCAEGQVAMEYDVVGTQILSCPTYTQL